MSDDIGLHKLVPAADYHSWPHVSNSRLNLLARCPAQLQYELAHPRTQTDAMRIGEALHLMVLQPHLVESRIAVAPECDRRTKAGKETWAAFLPTIGDRLCVNADEWLMLNEVAHAVDAKPEAKALLSMPGDVELSGVFIDIDAAVKCKMRLDKLVRFTTDGKEYTAIVDLKTTDDCDPAELAYTCRRYNYDRQAAFYLHGLAALGVFADAFYFVFVSKTPPHMVTVVEIDPGDIERARREIVEDLLTHKACQQSGVWPQHTSGIIKISVPPRRRAKEST